MKIMVVDDGHERCRRIEEACKTMDIETVIFHQLMPAIEYLKFNHVDGIITDRSYPLKEGEDEDKSAGIKLLNWLADRKKRIPVLGNSTMQFVSDYSYYKGKMDGYINMHIFYDFISSIGNHN